ncbi:hypothetical protein FQN52_000183 [Onygenales sp. PD_12]|nr:hypothetical protein FQN52_000183 [Onygenales sp. PD_12]
MGSGRTKILPADNEESRQIIDWGYRRAERSRDLGNLVSWFFNSQLGDSEVFLSSPSIFAMSLPLRALRHARPRASTPCRLRQSLPSRPAYLPLLRANHSDAAAPTSISSGVAEEERLSTPEIPSLVGGGHSRGSIADRIEVVATQSRSIQIKLGHSKVRAISNSLLRESCHCAQCVDQSTKQREFRLSDMPLDIQVREAKTEGNQLVVKWKNDIPGYDSSHTSRYPREVLAKLTRFRYSSMTERSGRRIMWDKTTFRNNEHWISFKDYMEDDSAFLYFMRSLFRLGLVFVKDIPDSSEMVEKIATRMGPLRNSFYGLTWDVRSVPNAKNVAYTNKHLDFHMDLLYMKDPPGYQMLHCLRNSFEGGESLFVDTFKAAQSLRKNHPEHFRLLIQHRTSFEYENNNEHYQHSHPVIELDVKPTFLRTPQLPEFLIRCVNYSPPFQGLPEPTTAGHQSQVIAAMKAFADEIAKPENIWELKLNPGECVIFANRRVVHARNGFTASDATQAGDNGAERWLRGAYVDDDALQSIFRRMEAKDSSAWTTPFRFVQQVHANGA